MGLLKNIERIALDIVAVEAQVIPAVVASVLTGGVGGALVTGLTVGTQAILGQINAKSFEGDGLTFEQLQAVNLSLLAQDLPLVNRFGVPLRGFVLVIARANLAPKLPRRPSPGRVARERFAARARAEKVRGRVAARTDVVAESPQISQSLADVPITPRQRPFALPVGMVSGTAVPTLLVSRKEQKRGQLFRPVRSVVFRGDPGLRARRSLRRDSGRRQLVRQPC